MNRLTLKSSVEPLSKLDILQIRTSPSSPVKRSIKIHLNKLPTDFFSENQRKLQKHDLNLLKPSRNVKENNSKYSSESKTSNKCIETCQTAQSSRTPQAVENQFGNNDDQLIIRLIQTTKDIKRMIRKHSIEVRRSNKQKEDTQFQLPPLKTARPKYTQ